MRQVYSFLDIIIIMTDSPLSSAILLATEVALILRGCVQTMLVSRPLPEAIAAENACSAGYNRLNYGITPRTTHRHRG